MTFTAWHYRGVIGSAEPLDGATGDAHDWGRVRESVLTWLTQMAELEPQAARRVEPAIEFPAMAAYTIDNVIAQVAIHSAHHLGQIATLRQIQGSWPLPLGSWTW